MENLNLETIEVFNPETKGRTSLADALSLYFVNEPEKLYGLQVFRRDPVYTGHPRYRPDFEVTMALIGAREQYEIPRSDGARLHVSPDHPNIAGVIANFLSITTDVLPAVSRACDVATVEKPADDRYAGMRQTRRAAQQAYDIASLRAANQFYWNPID